MSPREWGRLQYTVEPEHYIGYNASTGDGAMSAIQSLVARVERAVEAALNDGYRTPDILAQGTTRVDTEGMGSAVAERLTAK